jgi:DNA-binding CsgD family transcriptional regulator
MKRSKEIMDVQALDWDLNNAIVHIYEAALEPSLWPNIIQQLSFSLEGAKCFLLYIDGNLRNHSCLVTADGFNDFNAKTYSETEFHREFSSVVIGEVIFLDKETPVVSNIYNPQNSYPALFSPSSSKLCIPLLLGDNFGMLIVEASQDKPLPKNHMAILQKLSPHFVRAIQIHNHLITLKNRNDYMIEALQRTNIPVFILNADLQVIFTSNEAEQLLIRQKTLQMNPKRHLKLFFAEEQNTLIRLLNNVFEKDVHTRYWEDEKIGLAIHHPDRLHPIRLCFLPIQKPNFQQSQLPLIAIFAVDLEQPRDIAPEYLKQAFNLTPTEIHVAQLLVSGFNIDEIAEIRNTTLESTRWQMKQVLHKTHTHSQAELVRMLMVLGNILNSGA